MMTRDTRPSDRMPRVNAKMAIMMGILILAIPLVAIGQSTVYAQGNSTTHNDDGGANDNHQSASGNSENGGNQTSSESSKMSQSEEYRQNGNNTGTGVMNDDDHSSHPTAGEKRREYASETAGQRHNEHVAMHGQNVGPYITNMNYTLTANGTATSVSDNSTSTDVSISMNLSVWKSTDGLVSMDIMNGTINIGDNETIQIHNGYAYYLVHNHQFRALGFIVDTNNASSSGGQGNETTSMNLQLLKLYSGSDRSGGNLLPTSSAGQPLEISILSPQSKLASEWFLKMSGEVKLG